MDQTGTVSGAGTLTVTLLGRVKKNVVPEPCLDSSQTLPP